MCLAATVLLLIIPAFADAAGTSEGGPGIPLNRCFCVQRNAGLPPYYIARLTPSLPQCEKTEYKVNKKAPFMDLLRCEDLTECLKDPAQRADKRKILENKISEARERSAACCKITALRESTQKPSACDDACLEKWAKATRLLMAEIKKIDKETKAAHDVCSDNKKRWGEIISNKAGQ